MGLRLGRNSSSLFENRVLRKNMGITEDCRKCDKELHKLLVSTDFVWASKRGGRWAGRIERIRAKWNVHNV
jgi:hypothetical protein